MNTKPVYNEQYGGSWLSTVMDIQKGTNIFDLFDKVEPPRPKMDPKDVLCAFDIKFCTMCNMGIKKRRINC